MDIVRILSNLSLQSRTDCENENPRGFGRNSRLQRPWFRLGMLGVRESVVRADEQPSGATSNKFGPRGKRPSGQSGRAPPFVRLEAEEARVAPGYAVTSRSTLLYCHCPTGIGDGVQSADVSFMVLSFHFNTRTVFNYLSVCVCVQLYVARVAFKADDRYEDPGAFRSMHHHVPQVSDLRCPDQADSGVFTALLEFGVSCSLRHVSADRGSS